MYKRLQQANALPAAPPSKSGVTLDIHSMLRSLGVVHDQDGDEMDDDACEDLHGESSDSLSSRAKREASPLTGSGRGLSPASDRSHAASGNVTLSLEEHTLLSELVHDYSQTNFDSRSGILGSARAQGVTSPWKTEISESTAPAVMSSSTHAANPPTEPRCLRQSRLLSSTTTSSSELDITLPFEPTEIFWGTPMLPDNYAASEMVKGPTEPPIPHPKTYEASPPALDSYLPVVGYGGAADAVLPTYGSGPESFYRGPWDAMA